MTPNLQPILAKQRIPFKLNPLNAPHFGGIDKCEILSIKTALETTCQSCHEEVLHSVITEIKGILNSKPLGYVSSNVANPNPVTPNLLVMGW